MEILLNNKSFDLITESFLDKLQLNQELNEILKAGFTFVQDCWIMKSMYEGNLHIKLTDFPDKTGYECFINSIHIDDYFDSDLLFYAFVFVEKLSIEWKKLENQFSLEVIMSETDFGYNIKWHTVRVSEKWILEPDLNKFEEGITIFRF